MGFFQRKYCWCDFDWWTRNSCLWLVCPCPAILTQCCTQFKSPGSRFFEYCICIIMLHSHLNDMEIPETKRFIPKGSELVCRIGLPCRPQPPRTPHEVYTTYDCLSLRFCWKRTWHGTICNCNFRNLSCPTKRFHGTKRICQVIFNIYIVGVVSMYSSLSLHSRSIPTVNRLTQKHQAQVAFVACPLLSPVVSMKDFIKSFCRRQDDFL